MFLLITGKQTLPPTKPCTYTKTVKGIQLVPISF